MTSEMCDPQYDLTLICIIKMVIKALRTTCAQLQ